MSHNETKTSQSLLASLTGGEGDADADADADQDLFGDIGIPGRDGNNVEEDLFGNISLDDRDPLLLMHSHKHNDDDSTAVAPAPHNVSRTNGTVASSVPAVAEPPPPAPSLLASSGLLKSNSDPRSDGLFDAVDEEQARLDQEEDRRRAVQRERIEQDRARQEAERAAEQARLAQQLQARQQQQQPQQQPQQHPQQSQLSHDNIPVQGFYRNHNPPPPVPPTVAAVSYNGHLQYSTTGGSVQTHTFRRPIATAGMHSASSTSSSSSNMMIRPPSRTITAPTSTDSPYSVIRVTEPMLVASGGLFINSPYWSYQVETSLKDTRGHWLVRRRFKHVVALEDRLRQECPGSILPPRYEPHFFTFESCFLLHSLVFHSKTHLLFPNCIHNTWHCRPDKHATRAIEEASTLQSAEFAIQRAQELSQYLNELAQHPQCSSSTTLRLFLALQDDMGTAWPEVSSNTFTRLSALGGGAASSVLPNLPANKQHELEDNAELLALHSSEELRMGAVTQAVPKLEGCITLIREHADASGAVGMELSKLCQQVEMSESEIPLSTLSGGLLRACRREKRLAVELSAAMQTYIHQYKVCRYEKMAFSDRRQALARCHKERVKADERAQKLLFGVPTHGGDDRLAREAVVSDELAVHAVRDAHEIGQTLKSEVNRVAFERRTEWSKSMKVVASAMKEASAERAAIWESTRESFLQAFPDSK